MNDDKQALELQAPTTQLSQPSQQSTLLPPPLPHRSTRPSFSDDDPANPISYIRSPHILTAYLVPFPKPKLHNIDPSTIPQRFLIYTPPPPPLQAPPEGSEKDESKFHKVQRKWQEEVRTAKESRGKVKTASWQGVKSKATRGIDWAIGKTTSADLDFLGRVASVGGEKKVANKPSAAEKEGASTPPTATASASTSDDEKQGGWHDKSSHEDDKATVGLDEMVLIYPPSMGNDTEAIKAEFVNTMMRTKSKAEKDAVIGTALLPVAAALDLAMTLVWPFGGLLEIDGVWTYASVMGAKTARSVTKRLHSTDSSSSTPQLKLTFRPSTRNDVIAAYLTQKCVESDHAMFDKYGGPTPTPSDVLRAIGWEPEKEERNWEDEMWQTQQVKEDLDRVMKKGAKYWGKWCKAFEKDPKKALKK